MSWLTPALVTIILTMVKTIVVLLAVVICGALLGWVERRLFGLWQDHYGLNRVGSLGVSQLGVDMVKMFFKEDWTPSFADKMILTPASVIAMSTLFVALVTVSITPTRGVADLNIGTLFFSAVVSLTVYVVLFAGWSSNNRLALFSSLRASTQIVPYKVFLASSLIGIVAQVGLLNMRNVVQYQIDNVWFTIPQFFGFCTFIITGVAVTHRHPFDQPEAEQELVDGYHIEYTGMKWGMFLVGEYIGIVLVSALLATLSFNGWHGPLLGTLPWLSSSYFAAKTGFFIMLLIPIHTSLPRPRYDQVMAFSWKVYLPLILINLLVTGALVLAATQQGEPP